jgi:hypothetical protein
MVKASSKSAGRKHVGDNSKIGNAVQQSLQYSTFARHCDAVISNQCSAGPCVKEKHFLLRPILKLSSHLRLGLP